MEKQFEPIFTLLLVIIEISYSYFSWATYSCILFYQLLLILTVLLHINLIKAHAARSHSMCLNQVTMMLHFLNEVVSDIESTQKSINTSLSLV